MFPITASLKDFLTNWFKALPKLFPKGTPFCYTDEGNMSLLLTTTNICHYLVRNIQSQYILEHKLLHLIGKLADYRLATSLLLCEMLQLDQTESYSLSITENSDRASNSNG
ncbi:hypothetical protein B9Z19DRAFT_1121704 [Tuber borchii]|uniref:Uncharacterized protein n=1 Tax=Tuber borchii TaxID=42251 RepID=A0A2T7A254_TUBBO|nr:hypothetical protein B9Z19DRAFT_1121704 [Tuber borchii]